MVDIFDVADLVDMTLENTTNRYFSIDGKLVHPNHEAEELYHFGIDFCRMKENYYKSAEMRRWFDEGYLVSVPITDAVKGAKICPFESGGIGGAVPPADTSLLWRRTPDGMLFSYDEGRSRWLSVNFKPYTVGRGFATTTDLALYGVDGTPTGQTPVVFAENETLVGMTLESESTAVWTAKLRDFTTKADIAGAAHNLSGTKASYTHALTVDFNAGDQVEVYLDGTSISFPRVTLYTRVRGS
jgi:hypothetical protein